MANSTLETLILINAQVGNGFSQVGSTLQSLATQVQQITGGLNDLFEDSVGIYESFEVNMAQAEIALASRYGQGTQELSNAMSRLNDDAARWAANTIFHTDDISNAIVELARAGMGVEEIEAIMPSAISLAQAGNVDLSEGIEMLTKTSKALGLSDEQIYNFADMWVYAANSSVSSVESMGAAMETLGSVGRLAGSEEELLTMIAVMHNMGMEGSTAGTALRTAMIRLLAPTEKAQELFKQMGLSESEIAEGTADMEEAMVTLSAHGFSAFDANGNAKPMLQVFRELGQIVGGMSEQDADEVLYKIFGIRGMTAAMNMFEGMEDATTLYDNLMSGAYQGYGQFAQEIMTNTLYGSTQIYESKLEELKRMIGEELAPDIENLNTWMGGIVDSLREMDPTAFSAIVDALKIVAASGTGLMGAALFFKIMGSLFTLPGAMAAGAIAVTAIAAALNTMSELKFDNLFGDMELDKQGLGDYIQGLAEPFETTYEKVESFSTALETAVDNYKTASSTFSSKLFTFATTGQQLTETDIAQLEQLGTDMYNNVMSGVQAAAGVSTSFWEWVFGGTDSETFGNFSDIINSSETDLESSVIGIGAKLRMAMHAAFKDGEITDEEYQDILNYVRQYNDALARAAQEAADEEQQVQMQMLLNKAQTANIDDLQEISKEFTSERDRLKAERQEQFDHELALLQVRGASEEDIQIAQDAFDKQMFAIDSMYNEGLFRMWDNSLATNGLSERYQDALNLASDVLNGNMSVDDALGMFGLMGASSYAGDFLGSTTSERAQIGKALGNMVKYLGGEDEIMKQIAGFEKVGDLDGANRLKTLLTAEKLANNFADIVRTEGPSWDYFNLLDDFATSYFGSTQYGWQTTYKNRAAFEESGWLPEPMNGEEAFIDAIQGAWMGNDGYNWGDVFSAYQSMSEKEQAKWDLFAERYVSEAEQRDAFGERYADMQGNAMASYIAAWLNGVPDDAYLENQAAEKEVSPELINAIQGWWNQEEGASISEIVDAWGALSNEEQNYVAELASEYDVTSDLVRNMLGDKYWDIQSNPALTGIVAGVLGNYGTGQGKSQAGLEVGADTTAAEGAIAGLDGKNVNVNVGANTSSAVAAINALGNRTISVDVRARMAGASVAKGYAEGGRATEASIFGEAGPEWAIPEEHSQRTADLLDQARAASGFTWPELLSMYGGLNGNAGGGDTTIIYSPTIQAADATGVEAVLRADKARFEKWMEEREFRERREVYA